MFRGFENNICVTTPHYILNIQQFSLLTKQHVERYESNEFEAAGYKWKLVIHPNGNKSKDAGEFLSLYLAMADATSLPPGWEVYATFRIFLLDQNNDNYMTLEGNLGSYLPYMNGYIFDLSFIFKFVY
ncbi:putative ubiquitinyl hydrolase 1 [Helianthus annuus]|nr:putative ubiquitinyl hydrolase 1 [Helianthus annuus]KAJ0623853.1 putative ubiquitinyl hydrolase 1 [Helianthus annuus]KAJ0784047.1 putative ubiquitinyl hydrolase 1 [Helianthus annuus]